MDYSFNIENFNKIISAEVVPNDADGLNLSFGKVDVNIDKPYINMSGKRAGNSIWINNNDGLIVDISTSNNNLSVCYRENETQNFMQLHQNTPKEIIDFVNLYWIKVIDEVLNVVPKREASGMCQTKMELVSLEEYKKQFKKDNLVGWNLIDAELLKIYPQQNPKYYAPRVRYKLGGEEPLDGIGIYESEKQEKHFHFITYGFSELYYDNNSVKKDFDNYGFELTFRLKIDNDNVDWVCNLLQEIAKSVFKSKRWLSEFQVVPLKQPIKNNHGVEITALTFVPDLELGTINTPHGEVVFLQMIGLTTSEFQEFLKNPVASEIEKLIEKVKQHNDLLITKL